MRPSPLLYRVIWPIAAVVTRAYWRLRFEGRGNIPAEGPFILAPVHRSNVDFLVVALTTRQRVRFMAKDSLWGVPGLEQLVTALGAFPVQRDHADREALNRCMEVLEAGEPLVVFPEGRRREGPVVEDVYEGAAYLAIRAGVPVIPIGIGGSAEVMPRGSKMVRPARVSVIIGEAVLAPPRPEHGRTPRSAVRDLTETIRKELQRCFDEAEARAQRRKSGAG